MAWGDALEFSVLALQDAQAVGFEGLLASAHQPQAALLLVVPGFQHHHVMVAAECDEAPCRMQLQQQVEDAARVGATVDVVAECDELVVRFERDGVEQGRECCQAARECRRSPRTRMSRTLL